MSSISLFFTLLFWGKLSSSSFPRKHRREIHFVVQPNLFRYAWWHPVRVTRIHCLHDNLSLFFQKAGHSPTWDDWEKASKSPCFNTYSLPLLKFPMAINFWIYQEFCLKQTVSGVSSGVLDFIWLRPTISVNSYPYFFLLSNVVTFISFPILIVSVLFVLN